MFMLPLKNLAHKGLIIDAYDSKYLGQHWYKWWLVACQLKAITWLNTDWLVLWEMLK